MHILLIRHGQDEAAYHGGWSQRGLIDQGFAQSRALAHHLRTHWQPIRLLLSSDLRRAAETTHEILREVPVPLRYAPEWREMNNGELAGMLKALADARYPGLAFHTLAMHEAWPKGESPRQFFARIQHAWTTLCESMRTQHLPEDIAVIMHGGPINIVNHLLKGVSWSNQNPFFPTVPTGIHEVTCLDGGWQLPVFGAKNGVEHQGGNAWRANACKDVSSVEG
jgi:broad specificity phosphatase PhoE